MQKGFSEKEFKLFLKKYAKGVNIDLKIDEKTMLDKIRTSWNEIAPQLLLEHSVITGYTNGNISLRCDHGIYAQEVKFQTRDIIRKIQKTSGLPVKSIQVHVGAIYHKKTGKSTDIMSQNENMSAKVKHPNEIILEKLIQGAKKT